MTHNYRPDFETLVRQNRQRYFDSFPPYVAAMDQDLQTVANDARTEYNEHIRGVSQRMSDINEHEIIRTSETNKSKTGHRKIARLMEEESSDDSILMHNADATPDPVISLIPSQKPSKKVVWKPVLEILDKECNKQSNKVGIIVVKNSKTMKKKIKQTTKIVSKKIKATRK